MDERDQSSTMLERLRGIYFIDPDEEEYKEILKNARRRLERLHNSRDADVKHIQVS